MLPWLHRWAVLAHLAAVVIWFGAVAYYLLLLRPGMRDAGLTRDARYALLVAIKARLRRVVGVAVVVLVASGAFNAWVLGLLDPARTDPFRRYLFMSKLAIGGVLVATFLFALTLLKRVRSPARRGRLFILVHVAVLALGTLAAAAGVMLSH